MELAFRKPDWRPAGFRGGAVLTVTVDGVNRSAGASGWVGFGLYIPPWVRRRSG